MLPSVGKIIENEVVRDVSRGFSVWRELIDLKLAACGIILAV
jgi:hypothetical protein